MSLNHQLAAFDRLRGREPVDGTVISGFGPGSDPPPDLPPGFGGVTGQPEDPFGIHDEPLPAADLIPRRSPADPRGPASTPPEAPGEPVAWDPASIVAAGAHAAAARLPSPDFLVMGAAADAPHVAVCGGREVVLNDVERARVRRTVLQAIARSVRDQLRDIEALLPKRRRRAVAAEPVPVKRVRRKTVLHP